MQMNKFPDQILENGVHYLIFSFDWHSDIETVVWSLKCSTESILKWLLNSITMEKHFYHIKALKLSFLCIALHPNYIKKVKFID
jgi:hypothetical protein